jgi:hypothetical protein
VFFRPLDAEPIPYRASHQARRYALQAVGVDKAGIVAKLSRCLADQRVNIAQMRPNRGARQNQARLSTQCRSSWTFRRGGRAVGARTARDRGARAVRRRERGTARGRRVEAEWRRRPRQPRLGPGAGRRGRAATSMRRLGATRAGWRAHGFAYP